MFKGFGFVEFDDTRDAEDAIDALDGKYYKNLVMIEQY